MIAERGECKYYVIQLSRLMILVAKPRNDRGATVIVSPLFSSISPIYPSTKTVESSKIILLYLTVDRTASCSL